MRAGVWEHSSFRKDPLNRLKRTGLAAMISVYGARSVAEPMIARVVRMHASVQGTTAAGIRYSANDPRLLTWVHATAAFGFAAAYDQYVQPLSAQNLDDYYREGTPVSRLYGAVDTPRSASEMQALFAVNASQARSVARHFRVPANHARNCRLPSAASVDAAHAAARRGGIGPRVAARQPWACPNHYGLRRHERRLVKWAGACADRIVLPTSPAVQSCLRLGLPMNLSFGHALPVTHGTAASACRRKS